MTLKPLPITITIDADAQASYIYLGERAMSAKSVEYPNGLIADFDANGNPVGIEILRPITVNTVLYNNTLGDDDNMVDIEPA